MNQNEWDKVADDWNNSMRNGDWFQRYIIYPTIKELLGNIQEKKIIDIGCGNGHLSRHLFSMGACVVGVDKSERMILACKQYDSSVTFRVCDITSENHFQQEFDCAIFNNSLQDIQSYQAALTAASRLLCNQGVLLIVIKHPCFHPSRQDLGWLIGCDDEKCFYTGQGLTDLYYYQGDFEGKYFIMDDYFDSSSHIRSWFGKETVSYTRTLQEYINSIIKCGFAISELREPTPQKEGAKENPSLYKLLMRIPNFLIIKAIKFA